MRLRGNEEDVLGPSEGSGAGFSADRLQAPPSQITGTRAPGTMGRIPWGILGSDFSLIHTIGRNHWYFLDSDLCPHVLQFGVGVWVWGCHLADASSGVAGFVLVCFCCGDSFLPWLFPGLADT